MKAIWNDKIIAESDETVVVEGNHYFPLESIDKSLLSKSNYQTVCPWKGKASYYDVVVDGNTNKDAAWYYKTPSDKAKQIKDHVAFWMGVQVMD